MVDIQNSLTSNKYWLEKSQKTLTPATLNVIITDKYTNKDFIKKVYNFVKRKTRAYVSSPNFLFIILYDDYSATSLLRNILKELWTDSIINFTILKIKNINSNPTMLYYDPFIQVFHEIEYSNSSIEITPDKLKNLNGHNVNVGFPVLSSYIALISFFITPLMQYKCLAESLNASKNIFVDTTIIHNLANKGEMQIIFDHIFIENYLHFTLVS